MDIIPEMNCASCGQKVPIDRDCCPYCRTEIKSYWFENLGEVKRAIPLSENGIDYLLIDGKKLSLKNINEIPYALHQCLIPPKDRKSQEKFDRILKQIARVFFEDSANSDAPLPSQWENWLDK